MSGIGEAALNDANLAVIRAKKKLAKLKAKSAAKGARRSRRLRAKHELALRAYAEAHARRDSARRLQAQESRLGQAVDSAEKAAAGARDPTPTAAVRVALGRVWTERQTAGSPGPAEPGAGPGSTEERRARRGGAEKQQEEADRQSGERQRAYARNWQERQAAFAASSHRAPSAAASRQPRPIGASAATRSAAGGVQGRRGKGPGGGQYLPKQTAAMPPGRRPMNPQR